MNNDDIPEWKLRMACEEAAAAWNTRTPDPRVEKLVEAAKELVRIDKQAIAELEMMGLEIEPETYALTDKLEEALAEWEGRT